MAKTIGSLSALVGANTKGLEKGLKRAGRLVRGYARSINSIGSGVVGKIGAIGAAVGIGVSIAGLKSIASDMDEVAKKADSLGFTTEALIGLRHAAGLAGVESAALNTSLQTMVKNVGLAAQGTGRAQAALAGLGLDAKKLAEVSPENQLKILADAMASVENPTTRATYAMQIFGGEGAAMINVMKGGAAAIEAAQMEAEKLGLTFSRVDAAKVEAANDSLARMSALFTGLAQTLVIELAPYVDAAATSFVNWGSDGTGAADKVIGAVEWVASTIAKVTDVLDYAKIAWYGLKIAGVAAIKAMILPVGLLVKGITKLVELASDYLPQSLVDAAAQAQAFADGFDSGLTEVADDAAAKIDEIWTGPSRADAVEKYFAEVRAKAEEAAKAVAASAPKPQAYSQEIFAGVQKATGASLQDIIMLEQRIKDLDASTSYSGSSGPSLVRAGSAEAQSFGLNAEFDRQEKLLLQQIAIEREIKSHLQKKLDAILKELESSNDETADILG